VLVADVTTGYALIPAFSVPTSPPRSWKVIPDVPKIIVA
jgi:hypothetical protein